MSLLKELTQEDVGQPCTYFDPYGRPRAALITAVHGKQCVNVVFVHDDKNQYDSYGLKIERSTSVMHGDIQQAHGNYFLMPGEERTVKA